MTSRKQIVLGAGYPLHDKGAYKHLLKPEDEDRLEWVKLFNQFDLYTKDGDNDLRVCVNELWPYYQKLIEKYGLDGKLKW
jgi:inositol oxygenase